jgi:hypothetical protein
MGKDFPSRTFFIAFIKAHLQMPGQVYVWSARGDLSRNSI